EREEATAIAVALRLA
ncbi:hypothetical protein ACNVD4_23495, partial [Rhizobium sp. BR5]